MRSKYHFWFPSAALWYRFVCPARATFVANFFLQTGQAKARTPETEIVNSFIDD
jgi:hypothetical protein